MRVEAFENAASAQGNMRPKRVKDVVSCILIGERYHISLTVLTIYILMLIS